MVYKENLEHALQPHAQLLTNTSIEKELQRVDNQNATEVTALQPELLTNKYWEGCNNLWCSYVSKLQCIIIQKKENKSCIVFNPNNILLCHYQYTTVNPLQFTCFSANFNYVAVCNTRYKLTFLKSASCTVGVDIKFSGAYAGSIERGFCTV